MASQRGLDFLLKAADAGLTGTVATGTEIWTTSAHGWSTEQAIEFSTTGTLPASTPSIAVKTIYYINVASSTTFTVHTTLAAANAGTGAIDFTDTGSGTHTVHGITTLAGMRSTAFTLSNEMVEITNKDSAGARSLLANAGVQALSLPAAGVFTDAAIEEIVRGYAFADSINRFHLFLGNGDTLSADFKVANYERGGEYNGEETYSLTLESSGSITYTAV